MAPTQRQPRKVFTSILRRTAGRNRSLLSLSLTGTLLLSATVQGTTLSPSHRLNLNSSWHPNPYEAPLRERVEDALTNIRHFFGATSSPGQPWQLPGSGPQSGPPQAALASFRKYAVITPSATSASALDSGQGLIPWESFDNYTLSTDTQAVVDQGNGNLILQSNDGSLHTAGIPLTNDRYFNSVTGSAGSLGGQWSSALSGFDTGLFIGSTNRSYVGESGNVEKFVPDGSGGWTHPRSFDATLTSNSSASTLVMNNTGETMQFNGSGWLLQDVDQNNLGNSFTYNASGQVTKVTEQTGRFYTLTWSSGSPSVINSITDSANRTTTYTHDSAGRLTRVDSPGGYWETYTYNAAGLVSELQAVGPTTSLGILVDFTYDSADRVLSIAQGTIGSSTYARTTTYSGWGPSSTVTVTDGNGHATLRGISASNVPISSTDPLGRKSSWTHNANGDVTSYTAPGATNSGQTNYNGNNVITGTAAPTGAATTTTYGSVAGCAGSGGSAYDPHCTTDSSGSTTAFNYDSSGNLLQTADTTPGGTGVTDSTFGYASAANGCYSTTDGGVTTVHGLAGQVCSSTSAKGQQTTHEYDASGNETAVSRPAPLARTSATYDSLGRTTSSTDGNGRVTSFTYNVRDQVVSTTYSSGAVLTSSWTPNAVQSSTSIDASNKDTYTYDVLGQLITESDKHNSVTRSISYAYDGAGNLISYVDPYGTVTYGYDAANELVQLIEPGGMCGAGTPAASSGCTKFTYDSLGQESSRTFPGGAILLTTRDAAARPTRITAKSADGTTVSIRRIVTSKVRPILTTSSQQLLT